MLHLSRSCFHKLSAVYLLTALIVLNFESLTQEMCDKHWKINQLSYSSKSCFNWLLVLNGKRNAFYDSFMSIVVNKYNMKTLIKIWLKNHNSFILILYHQINNELELYSSCEICLPTNTFIDNGNGYHTNNLKFLTKFILDINNFYTSCFGNK